MTPLTRTDYEINHFGASWFTRPEFETLCAWLDAEKTIADMAIEDPQENTLLDVALAVLGAPSVLTIDNALEFRLIFWFD